MHWAVVTNNRYMYLRDMDWFVVLNWGGDGDVDWCYIRYVYWINMYYWLAPSCKGFL